MKKSKSRPSKKRSFWSFGLKKPSLKSKKTKKPTKKSNGSQKKHSNKKSSKQTRGQAVPQAKPIQLQAPHTTQASVAPSSSSVQVTGAQVTAKSASVDSNNGTPKAPVENYSVATRHLLPPNLLGSNAGVPVVFNNLETPHTSLFESMKSTFKPFRGLKNLRFGKSFLSIRRESKAAFPGPCYYTAQVSYGENDGGNLTMKAAIGRATAIGLQLKDGEGKDRIPNSRDFIETLDGMERTVLREVAKKLSDSVKSQDVAHSLSHDEQLVSMMRSDSLEILEGVPKHLLMAAIFSMIGRNSEFVFRSLSSDQSDPHDRIKLESKNGYSTYIQILDTHLDLSTIRLWTTKNK